MSKFREPVLGIIQRLLGLRHWVTPPCSLNGRGVENLNGEDVVKTNIF